MITRYRRKARGWNLGPLDPLDGAIPELASVGHDCPDAASDRHESAQVDHAIGHKTRDAAESGLLNLDLMSAFTSSSCVLAATVALFTP
jgi:hypothetical protein